MPRADACSEWRGSRTIRLGDDVKKCQGRPSTMERALRFVVSVTLFLTALVCLAFHGALAGPTVAPFNACTFYAPPYLLQSFAGGAPYAGCAEWSAMRGRNGCTKVKGVCPACVKYQGDHLQMWLPEFFIEVTTAPGESAFTEGVDGGLLRKHLALGYKTWKADTKALLPLPASPDSA